MNPFAIPLLDEVIELMPIMVPAHGEHLNYLSSADTAQDRRIKAAAATYIAGPPATVAEEWSQALGLELPREYWSLTVSLKVLDPESPDVPALDATIDADVKNYPGDASNWNLRIGTQSMNPLGDERGGKEYLGKPVGSCRRDGRRTHLVIEGQITPAQSIYDFPRVVADLLAAHPELSYNFAGLSISGGPEPARQRSPQEAVA